MCVRIHYWCNTWLHLQESILRITQQECYQDTNLSWFWLEHSSLAVIHTPAPNCSWAIIKCSIESDSMIVQSPAWSLGDCAQVSLRWKSINQVCNVIYDITHWSMVMYVKVEFSSFCNQHQHPDCDVRVFLDSISYMKQEITEIKSFKSGSDAGHQ